MPAASPLAPFPGAGGLASPQRAAATPSPAHVGGGLHSPLPAAGRRPATQQHVRPDAEGLRIDTEGRPVFDGARGGGLPPTERVLAFAKRGAPGARRRMEFTAKLRQAVKETEAMEDGEEHAVCDESRKTWLRQRGKDVKARRREESAHRQVEEERQRVLHQAQTQQRREHQQQWKSQVRQYFAEKSAQQASAQQRAAEMAESERARVAAAARKREQKALARGAAMQEEEQQHQQAVRAVAKLHVARLAEMHRREEEESRAERAKYDARGEEVRAALGARQKTCDAREAAAAEGRRKIQIRRAEQRAQDRKADRSAFRAACENWGGREALRQLPIQRESCAHHEVLRRGAVVKAEQLQRKRVAIDFRDAFGLTWQRMKRSREDEGQARQMLADEAERALLQRRAEDGARRRRAREKQRDRREAERLLSKIEDAQQDRQQRMAVAADRRGRLRAWRRARQAASRAAAEARAAAKRPHDADPAAGVAGADFDWDEILRGTEEGRAESVALANELLSADDREVLDRRAARAALGREP